MKKKFTTVLPDEPYKTSTKLNKTIECTYEGPRYILLRVRQSDGSIVCIDRENEDLEMIEAAKIEQHRLDPEEVFQVVLDAEVNTWEAAYVTGYYSHDPFPDHTETLPDGSTWTYHYDDGACAVEQPFYVNDMKYDRATSTYTRPRYRVHAVAKKDFWEGVRSQLDTYSAMLEGAYQDKGYTPEQIEKIKVQVEFLKTCEEKYGNVDHWKIPFPALIL